MIVTRPIEPLWSFLNARLNVPWSSDFRAIGVVQGGCLCAVAGYNVFTGRSCFMHIAIEDRTAVTRTFVREVFRYPFSQLGCRYVLATATGSNQSSVGQLKRLGFSVIDRLEETCLDGSDMLLLRMAHNECRWLDGKRRQGT